MKEKARFYQLQRHEQPNLITIKASELEERVRDNSTAHHSWLTSVVQAKEHDIYDISPFLHSKLFVANGYKLDNEVIEKRFQN